MTSALRDKTRDRRPRHPSMRWRQDVANGAANLRPAKHSHRGASFCALAHSATRHYFVILNQGASYVFFCDLNWLTFWIAKQWKFHPPQFSSLPVGPSQLGRDRLSQQTLE